MDRVAIALVLSQLGAGAALTFPLVPFRQVGKGYFLLGGSLGLAFTLLALLLRGWERAWAPSGGLPIVLLAGAFGVYLQGIAAGSARWHRRLLLLLCASAGWAAIGGAGAGVWGMGGGRWAAALRGGSMALGTVLLGSVLMAMILGHWYLVVPKLPASPLRRLSAVLLGALGVRSAGVLAAALLFPRESWAGPEGGAMAFLIGDGFFLGVRVLLGLAVPLVLAILVRETVKIRSMQSATGILYALVVFVLFGELISRDLLIRTGVPF